MKSHAMAPLVTLIAFGIMSCMMNLEARTRPDVSAEAKEAAQSVGEALRELRGYRVDIKGATRASIGGGKYRDFAGNLHYVVRPPDRLFARIEGKGLNRQVFYDGQAITVYAPSQMKYARIEAPGDIRTMLEQLRARKGLELPIADLFAWGTPDGPLSNPSRGIYSGTALIHGRPCKHYSYKQAATLWEIWIDDDDLPCKLVRIDTEDPVQPGYEGEFTWETMQATDDVFQFAPTASVTRVELSEIAESDPAP